jgi:xylulokinase
MSLIGMDIGTSAVKGVLLDREGRVLRQMRHGYGARRSAPWQAELSPASVWAATRRAIRRLSGLAPPRDPVQAVCTGGSGDEVVLLDDHDRPLGPVILALDRRAEALGHAIVDRFGREWLHARTGLPDAGATPLARLLWVREHEPRLAARIRRVLAWPEFISLRLGVPVGAEPTLAARTLGYALKEGRYDQAILGPLGVDPDLFAPLIHTGQTLGRIPSRIADDLGLPTGVSAVAGGFDQAMATLGAGVLRAGVAHVGTGTWEALSVLLADASAGHDLVDAGWSVGRSISAQLPWSAMTSAPGGIIVRWIGDLIAAGSARPAPGLGRLLSEAAAGPGPVLAVAGGAEQRAWSLAGLDLSSGRGQILAAILEATARRLAYALQQAEAVGADVSILRASGGGARSAVWLQTKADVTGRVVERTEVVEVGAFAAALLAGAAIDALPDPLTAADTLVRVRDRFEPRPDRQAWHAERTVRADRTRAGLAVAGVN